MNTKNGLSDYWPIGISTDEKKSRLDEFVRRIYPVIKPIIDAWEATFKDEKSEPEIVILHKLDNAIFDTGISPDRQKHGNPVFQERQSEAQKIYERISK